MGKSEGRRPLKDAGVNVRIILNCIFYFYLYRAVSIKLTCCDNGPLSVYCINRLVLYTFFFYLASLSLLILEVMRSHKDTTVGRTPLDEGSARRRDLYLTTHKHPCPRRDSNP